MVYRNSFIVFKVFNNPFITGINPNRPKDYDMQFFLYVIIFGLLVFPGEICFCIQNGCLWLSFIYFLWFFFLLQCLGFNLRALYTAGKCFTTELHHQPWLFWPQVNTGSITCVRKRFFLDFLWRTDINSFLCIWYNSPVKPSDLSFYFLENLKWILQWFWLL